MQQKTIVLVLGGVRSGKSRYAQRVAERFARVAFLATAERRDDAEMDRRIERHRSERPAHWLTVEEPLDVAGALRDGAAKCDVVLVDCLTLFASNLLACCGENETEIERRVGALCDVLTSVNCSVVLVSNEVGCGVVPAYALGRRFRDLAGEINQRVAALADHVCLMVAGLPLMLKGSAECEVSR